MTHHPKPPLSLTIYSTYTTTFSGIFCGEKLLASTSINNKAAGANLSQIVDSLLVKQVNTISELSFIGVYQGPGPFTSLRVTIAFAHGLLAATNIPLIGVNGFFAFAESWQPKNSRDSEYLLILLEAFCDEIYYGIFDNKKILIKSGYCHRNKIDTEIKPLISGHITTAGNVQELFEGPWNLTRTSVIMPQLEEVGMVALRDYQKNPQGNGFLLPLYLKHPAVHRIGVCPSQQ